MGFGVFEGFLDFEPGQDMKKLIEKFSKGLKK